MSNSVLDAAFEAEWKHIQARLLTEPKFAADFNRVFTGEYPTEDFIAQCSSTSGYHDFDCSGSRPSMICRVCGYKDRSVRQVKAQNEQSPDIKWFDWDHPL